MSEKVYLLLLKTGVYVSLFSVFLVFKNLLFPFITSKQISFNILIEILLVLWVAFIIKYPEYRPKWSYISFGLGAFFVALIASSVAGVDFNLSFWGDVERMLGVFHLLHFLAFYFIIITVMKKWEDWRLFFIISITFAAIVSLMGLGEESEAYSTIGNTAYVSGYLIFNFYFALLLFFKERNNSLRWLYLLPIPIYFLEFNNANTTGALVGAGFSFIVLFFLYGILAKNKKVKFATLGLFVAFSMFAGLALTYKDSDFIRKNSLLSPIAGIDLQKNTFQTRLISWRAAWQDFGNHPVLGTGHGNYAITFDRFFDPSFYNYTRQETYFDRAHNNLIDIASTSGTLGLLTYLSIFAAVAYYMVQGYRKKYMNIHEFVLISSLLVAYFVQNLAVFDSLVTYMGLMMTLGLIYWYYQQGEESNFEAVKEKGGKVARKISGGEGLNNKEIYSLLASTIVLFTIMFQYNILPLKMLTATIDGQRAWAAGDVDATMAEYEKALSYETVLDRDSINTLVRSFASNPSKFSQLSQEKRKEAIDFLVEKMQKNIDYNEEDSLNQMMYAQLLDVSSRVLSYDKDLSAHYAQRAMEAINKSIDASPGRIPIYFQKAQIQLGQGLNDEALATLRYAYELNPEYMDSSCHLGKTLLNMNKDEEEAYNYIGQCIDMGGARYLGNANQLKIYAERYKEDDIDKAILIYEYITSGQSKDTKAMVELAKLYVEVGNTEKAIDMAMKVAETDPSLQDYALDFIEELE